MRKGTFKIASTDDDGSITWREVNGLVDDNFGIRENTATGYFELTHLASGFKIGSGTRRRLSDVVELARIAGEAWKWHGRTIEDIARDNDTTAADIGEHFRRIKLPPLTQREHVEI